MRYTLAVATALVLLAVCPTMANEAAPAASGSVDPAAMAQVSPALARFTQDALLGNLWRRPGLTPRDRSIATVAALIARDQAIAMPSYFARALDDGVKPSELSEIITHLAFYSGWPNAMSAVVAARKVFADRGIDAAQLPPASPDLLPLDEAAEAKRAAGVERSAGPASPGLVALTGDLLFRDLWLRPGLAPRDRSLATVSALVATGQVAQIPFHLNRAMDNGLTKPEAQEVLAQLAFYAGWPNAFTAVPVFKSVFEARAR